MALSITCATEAQEIVKNLRADPMDLNLRVNTAKSLTDPNWEWMVEAEYVEFCIAEAESWKEGEVDNIAEKCKESLRDFMVPDRTNTWHQSNLTQLLVNRCDPAKSELGHVLSSQGVPGILVEVGSHAINEKVIDWELIKMLPGPLMLLINGALDPSTVIIEIVEHGGVLELIALIFLDKSFVDGPGPDTWFHLLQFVTHSAACPETACPLLCSERCTSVISTMLKRHGLWMKISVRLRELVKMKAEEPYKAARKKRLGGWLGIGQVVGLVESQTSEQLVTHSGDRSRATRIPRTDEQGCWYARCERHGRIDEETEWMLLRCSVCKRALYCSKACQSEDWKVVHKVECRSSTASK